MKKRPKKNGWRLRRQRLKNVAILPTLITLGNLVCGVFCVLYTARGFSAEAADIAKDFYQAAAGFILLGMVFDALDGRVARLTKTASNFGAQLDSLCDLITFGMAPAFLVYCMYTTPETSVPERLVTVVCVLYVMCAAIRLARFNIESTLDVQSHMEFSGLPSPASAGVIAASIIPWSRLDNFSFLKWISDLFSEVLPFFVLILAVLMISRIPYAHILNKLFKAPRPFVVFVEVILLGVFAVLFHEFSIFIVFFSYALSGPILWGRNKLRKKKKENETGSLQEESLF